MICMFKRRLWHGKWYYLSKGLLLFSCCDISDLSVLHRSVEHGHDMHGHRQTFSPGHEHRREEEEGEGTLKAESSGSKSQQS